LYRKPGGPPGPDRMCVKKRNSLAFIRVQTTLNCSDDDDDDDNDTTTTTTTTTNNNNNNNSNYYYYYYINLKNNINILLCINYYY
jgi:hypothetical protein